MARPNNVLREEAKDIRTMKLVEKIASRPLSAVNRLIPRGKPVNVFGS